MTTIFSYNRIVQRSSHQIYNLQWTTCHLNTKTNVQLNHANASITNRIQRREQQQNQIQRKNNVKRQKGRRNKKFGTICNNKKYKPITRIGLNETT